MPVLLMHTSNIIWIV